MYHTKFLLESLDAFIASAQHKLSVPELKLLNDIRDCIAHEQDQDKIEKGFFNLLKWFLIVKDYIDKL